MGCFTCGFPTGIPVSTRGLPALVLGLITHRPHSGWSSTAHAHMVWLGSRSQQRHGPRPHHICTHLPRSHTAQAHHHPVKWWCGNHRMHPHNCCAHHTSHIHLRLAYRPHCTCTHTSTMRTPTNCTPIVDMPVTPALVNPDPSGATPNKPMPANFDGTLVECTTCTHIASANPAPITVFMATSPVVPAVFTPSIVHGLCDFLALCSDS